eukprot:GDKI01028449.1.p1 GENE.GDKI01028449.1~~GDKI01028449.1.p1  ORF type:complete len:319 (-),score=61.38 GDKI01028449.1:24-980(-)
MKALLQSCRTLRKFGAAAENLPRTCQSRGVASSSVTSSSSTSFVIRPAFLLQQRRHASTEQQQESKASVKAFSIEEALFLAKEAGIFTTHELQTQIIKSPPFSPDRNPFVLENFFDTQEAEMEPDPDPAAADNMHLVVPRSDQLDESVTVAGATTQVPQVIHDSIAKHFNKSWTQTFMHNNREWLLQAEGKGTRKRSVAHVIIKRGTGKVVLQRKNGVEEDLHYRFPYYYHRMDILKPFFLTKTAGLFDVFVDARGGGEGGQAGAIRLAVGRALVQACPACAEDLAEDMVLYEDTRQKMPKMPGRNSARAMESWSKRG